MEPSTLPTTTYHCTISPTCKFSTTTFKTWVTHEVNSHPITTRNIWLCHSTPSVPNCTCDLAFISRTDFERHWFRTHPKDELDNWHPLRYEDYFIGPEADQLFWCGFCRRVFSCHMTKSWMIDRFEHVAAHFQAWHATWDHFEIKKWKYLDFWVAPVSAAKDETKLDGQKNENTEIVEADGVEISKHIKRSKAVKKKSKARKKNSGKKSATVVEAKKVAESDGTSKVAV